jgi:hypothetical protein
VPQARSQVSARVQRGSFRPANNSIWSDSPNNNERVSLLIFLVVASEVSYKEQNIYNVGNREILTAYKRYCFQVYCIFVNAGRLCILITQATPRSDPVRHLEFSQNSNLIGLQDKATISHSTKKASARNNHH